MNSENQRVINNQTKFFNHLAVAIALMAFLAIPMGMRGQTRATVDDVLTATSFTATSTTYTNFSGVTFTSDAVYAGNSSKTSSGGIQLRSKNSNSGIVSTASGGTIHAVSVVVESGGKTLDIYGKNTAYSAASDLYDSSTQGTKIGSISATGNVDLSTFVDQYEYIGLRSNDGALFLTSITITWTTTSGSGPTPLAVPTNFNATAGNGQAEFTWDAVSNASGYTISYTSDGSSWQEEPVTGGSTTNKTITSLTNGTTYTCKIKANGDGTTYSDSEYSSTITVTPTSTQYTVTLNAGNGTVNGETTISWNVSMNNGDLPAAEAPCSTWNFGGWSTSAVDTQTTTAPTYVPTHYVPTSDITLYAVYTKTEGGASFNGTTGGDFLIYAYVSGMNHYATGTISSSAITSTTTLEDAGTFTFEKLSNGNFTIKNGNSYISAASGSVGISGSNTACEWTISAGSNGGSWHVAIPNSSRGLIYRASTYNVFKNYASVNGSEYFDIEIGGGSTTYYHSTPDCVETVATPTFDTEGGTYYEPKLIIIECATSGAAIYYTLNGDEPTDVASSTNFLYDEDAGVEILNTTTLKAKAFKAGMNPSATTSATYTIIHDVTEPTLAASQIFTTDTYSVAITVPANTAVYYTTDNSTPSNTSTPYTAAFNIAATTTVKAIAYDTDGCASDVVSATYTRAYSLADAKALYDGTTVNNVTISLAGVQFIAKHGNYTYMQQGTTGLLFYGSHSQSLDNGDVFTAGTATGKITKFGENLELTNFTFADVAKEAGTLAASTTGVEITDITGEFSTYESRYIALESLEMDIDNLELSDGTNTLAIYDPLSILDQATQPDNNVVVTGIVTSYYKSNATTYQIVPIALTDITTGFPAALPTLVPAGGATADAAVSTDNVTVTPATNTSVIYTFGSETDEITAATVLTVPSTSATALELVASRDFYNDATATYYYKSSATMYNVTFYVNGTEDNTMAKEVVAGGELGTLQTATAPNGFTFMGWTETEIATIQDAVPTMVTATTPVNNDMTLYAVFALEKEETAGTTNKTLTLVYTDFVTTSYAANNGSHTKDGVSYYTNQIMKSTGKESVQFQKDAGYLYNTTPLNISSIQLNYHTDNAGTFKVYEGTSEHPTTTEISESAGVYTPNGSNQFFTIYCADGTGYLTSIVINYTAVTTNTVYTNYCTTVTILTLGDEVKTYAGACSIDQVNGFIIENGQTLVVGALGNTNPANLFIEDGGQLITNNAVSATMEKSIKGYTILTNSGDDKTNGWYTIASPVAGASLDAVTIGTYDLYRYDEKNMTWLNQELDANASLFSSFEQGIGYLYANNADQDLEFAGTMAASNSTVTVPLTCESTANLQGVNLVGNPFTCNISSNIKIGSADLTTYYYVADGAELATATLSARAIKPAEGFLVQASAACNLVFNPTSKDRDNTKPTYVCIEAGNDNFMDRAYVQIGQGNTLRKMTLNDNVAHISVQHDGKDFAAATIEEAQGEMPVNFKAAVDGTYTINVATEGIEANYLHLIDNITGMDVDLLQTPSYTFNARKSDYASRFRLVFSANSANENNSDSFAFISNGQIILTNVDNDATVQVIDALGRMIANTNANNHVYTDNMAPGVYVLRLVNGNDVKTQKIVVK